MLSEFRPPNGAQNGIRQATRGQSEAAASLRSTVRKELSRMEATLEPVCENLSRGFSTEDTRRCVDPPAAGTASDSLHTRVAHEI